ncbi:ATP synthase F1 subunit delta [Flavihumibacter sp. ZG627]|uniref:ATP synthase F1 subunit delta n=1 Tax=Flavihumibacter sp. ZG627 TaxID=1463156 RepID=UPI0005802F80|nr:ATP synthase F1 subunit delta [Flavihumibacter sp. ZG627]KIC92403.1 hypothetical protein HY58_02395 [Flavihumibacter sp. ZG627]
MRNTRVAKRYSKALMDLAVETNQVEAVKMDADSIRSAITGELNQVLMSPVIKHEKKIAIFKAIFSGKISPLTESFFNLLFAKGREVGTVDILNAFDEAYRELKGIQIIELTTAVPVSDEVKEVIIHNFSQLERFKNKKLQINEKVKEEILGGFVVQLDDQLYDASIRHDLDVIKKQFVDNMYIQKLR